MTSPACAQAEDALLPRMRAARRSRSVLKMDLVNLRADIPERVILAFEGVHDKGVYFTWLRRARPELDYEPFPCDGKTLVLELKKVVDEDLNGLKRGVYFFVDRDFDDLRDIKPDSSIFMTDQHSIENYLVSEDVLNELLKNEFHCHAQPALRDTVIAKFSELYDEFLALTRDINFRLFCARKLGIETVAALPCKIGQLARIDLDTVATLPSPEEAVALEREPTQAELDAMRPHFDELGGRERFRGKFALLFFLEWLRHLAASRVSGDSELFPDLPRNVKVRLHAITSETLATKSKLPEGLVAFAQSMSC